MTTPTEATRVGLLWRAEWDPVDPASPVVEMCRLHGVFKAFAELGVDADAVVYSDNAVDAVRTRLETLDGVLVWVNPIEQGRDRSQLDPLLSEAVESGVFVSARPDVILKLGTKEVLVDTKAMSWGTDTRIYRTFPQFRDELPGRLAEAGPIVLKQHRGMGGAGVWKVELDAGAEGMIVVQHASGAATPELIALDTFLAQCEGYFAGTGLMVEQPYQPRLPEGMIRAYLCHDEVVGFTHQYPRGLMPPGPDDRPASKSFEPGSEPRYRELRDRVESEWLPELKQTLGLETHELPVIWDIDLLYGPRDEAGVDTYVLCEVNVSSTFAFPEFAMPTVARAALDRIRERAA